MREIDLIPPPVTVYLKEDGSDLPPRSLPVEPPRGTHLRTLGFVHHLFGFSHIPSLAQFGTSHHLKLLIRRKFIVTAFSLLNVIIAD